jgi:hypothetical protein
MMPCSGAPISTNTPIGVVDGDDGVAERDFRALR